MAGATRSSKRKRAEVSYFEGESDFDDAYNSDEPIAVQPAPKKSKSKPAAQRPLSKKNIFPFISLPAELRNSIYEYCLKDSDDVYLISKTVQYRRVAQRAVPRKGKQPGYRASRRWYYRNRNKDDDEEPEELQTLVPAILAANRQIHTEALPILYDHTFVFEDTMVMHTFIAGLSQRNRNLVRNVVVREYGASRGYAQYNYCGLTWLPHLTNLQTIYFDCSVHWRGPLYTARQLYRDGFHWFETVGVAKGRYDAAVDLIDLLSTNIHRRAWGSAIEPSEEEIKVGMDSFQNELRRLLRAGMQKPRARKSKK